MNRRGEGEKSREERYDLVVPEKYALGLKRCLGEVIYVLRAPENGYLEKIGFTEHELEEILQELVRASKGKPSKRIKKTENEALEFSLTRDEWSALLLSIDELLSSNRYSDQDYKYLINMSKRGFKYLQYKINNAFSI